jgi:hypothetical protein
MVAAAVVLAPQMAAATTQPLFPAHNVFTSPSSNFVFGTTTLGLLCKAGDVTSIVSPNNPSGVIVDNVLTDNGLDLCGLGNPQLPAIGPIPSVGPSCFSKVINTTPGRPANQAYKGIGMIILGVAGNPGSLTPVGASGHTFRLQDFGVVGANNRLVLQTDCLVRGSGPGGGGVGGGPP